MNREKINSSTLKSLQNKNHPKKKNSEMTNIKSHYKMENGKLYIITEISDGSIFSNRIDRIHRFEITTAKKGNNK